MLDRPTLFMTGTAGAGKSTMTHTLSGWIGDQGLNSMLVNLDPGAEHLPYTPDVDIRDWVRLDDIMAETGLGPNGAQVAAADMVAVNLDQVQAACSEGRPDIYIVDTPGQLELFVFRAAGPFVATQLSRLPVIAFLMDPVAAQKPRGLASQLLLAANVQFRLEIPAIHVMSKMDLLPEKERQQLVTWLQDPDALLDALDGGPTSLDQEFNRAVLHALRDFSGVTHVVPASAETLEGLEDVYGVLTSLFAAGDRELPG